MFSAGDEVSDLVTYEVSAAYLGTCVFKHSIVSLTLGNQNASPSEEDLWESLKHWPRHMSEPLKLLAWGQDLHLQWFSENRATTI